jgi:hypothetical protein
MRSLVFHRSSTARFLGLVALIVLMSSTASVVKADDRHSEQIVFSGVGFFSSGPLTGSPFGFWVWCQTGSSGNGLYGADKACSGAMYVYALGVTKGVLGFGANGGVTEPTPGHYLMDVHSADGVIRATLINVTDEDDISHGPTNTVHVDFTSPIAGGGDSLNAVINITGKE